MACARSSTPPPPQSPSPILSPSPAASPTPLPSTPTPLPTTTHGSPHLLIRGPKGTHFIALTFDFGGKEKGTTEELLRILREHSLKATFFLTGQWIEANLELTRQMVAEGHEVGNHSFDHPDFTRISRAEMIGQVKQTEKSFSRLTGTAMRPYFRPPFGAYNQEVLETLASLGYRVVYWSLDSSDWRPETTADSVSERVTKNVQGGDIVVFHGYIAKTTQALPQIIAYLEASGHQLVPLSQLGEP
ncbi:MAG: polysaccharide deacetylase family protein [Chloroflexi bacterium]|nr:polysaccharide deacetylase family protein [Chloroflexota bacterium]